MKQSCEQLFRVLQDKLVIQLGTLPVLIGYLQSSYLVPIGYMPGKW